MQQGAVQNPWAFGLPERGTPPRLTLTTPVEVSSHLLVKSQNNQPHGRRRMCCMPRQD